MHDDPPLRLRRVALVQDQIEQRVLQLVGIDPGPQRRVTCIDVELQAFG